MTAAVERPRPGIPGPLDGVGASERFVRVSHLGSAMGGRLGIHLAVDRNRVAGEATAARNAMLVADRIRAWARLLTRFEATSDLVALNDDPREVVPVGPTLGAVLDWGAEAARLTGGIVDIAMLDARLAAEASGREAVDDAPSGRPSSEPASRPGWSLVRLAGRLAVARPAGLRFDLDGVAKGWIADRALALLWRYPGAIVDADGDLAIRVAPGDSWDVGIADPTTPGFDLAVLRLRSGDSAPSCFGLATSGVSVHRWVSARGVGHHLIDPRTGSPADTDVVQATVLASTAREAELLAKTAVILGSVGGLDFLDRSGAGGAVILTNRGERLALPRTLRWLA